MERQVYPVSNVVDDAICNRDPYPDVRVFRLKLSQHRDNQRLTDAWRSGQGESARDMPNLVRGDSGNGFPYFNAAPRVHQYLRADFSQSQTPGGAVEQAQAKLVLQFRNPSADTGHWHPQSASGFGEAAGIDDVREDNKRVQIGPHLAYGPLLHVAIVSWTIMPTGLLLTFAIRCLYAAAMMLPEVSQANHIYG